MILKSLFSAGLWYVVMHVFLSSPQNVTMVVDHCQTARNRDMDPPVTDRSMCQGSANIVPFKQYLNVNGPLQLGGVKHGILTTYNWEFAHTRKGFSGCIKNVIHNSQVTSFFPSLATQRHSS